MILRVQQYHLVVVYSPGKELHISDTLSRSTGSVLESTSDNETGEFDVHVVWRLPINKEKTAQFQVESDKDRLLGKLKGKDGRRLKLSLTQI